jgi:hypothetical protein
MNERACSRGRHDALIKQTVITVAAKTIAFLLNIAHQRLLFGIELIVSGNFIWKKTSVKPEERKNPRLCALRRASSCSNAMDKPFALSAMDVSAPYESAMMDITVFNDSLVTIIVASKMDFEKLNMSACVLS